MLTRITVAEELRENNIDAWESMIHKVRKDYRKTKKRIADEERVIEFAEKDIEYSRFRLKAAKERLEIYKQHLKVLENFINFATNYLEINYYMCPSCGDTLKEVKERQLIGTGGDYSGMAPVPVGFACENCEWEEEI